MMRCGSEWAVNSTLVFSGIVASLAAQVGGDELHERGLGGPAVDAAELDAVRLGGGASPVVVLADGERGVVRRQHQADDAAEALCGDGVDGFLDLRRRRASGPRLTT